VIRVRRVYEPEQDGEGPRFLVERLWPRGLRKEALEMDGWVKDVAPSPALRKWFSHDPAKWDEFRVRYVAELEANAGAWQPIAEASRQGNVTLLYSARDQERNSAVVLKQYLDRRLAALRPHSG
jgi:uncharacterized protein YeaO (DUF488 family)